MAYLIPDLRRDAAEAIPGDWVIVGDPQPDTAANATDIYIAPKSDAAAWITVSVPNHALRNAAGASPEAALAVVREAVAASLEQNK